MHYSIPEFGIEVEVNDKGTGIITSNLHAVEDEGEDEYNAACDGLESLILGHACAGLDISAPAYVTGIRTAVEAIANHF